MPRALLSVSNKSGIVEFARGLASRGYQIVSTGGTARLLTDAGVPVTNVSDVTGFPEMMDGRVKTLHPNIHGGILARRGNAEDLHAIARHGIQPIDVVAVNLYPFAETARKPGVTLDELIEQIDIGGPSMVRAAAKNYRDVLVVVDPSTYGEVLKAIDDGATEDFRYRLMLQAFAHTAEYDLTIARTMRLPNEERTGLASSLDDSYYRPTIEFADRSILPLEKIRDLRYGENPHQCAAWYRVSERPGATPPSMTILQGKELSFTNLLDLDAATRIVLEFNEPAAAVIKHTNPCGAAVGASAVDAYVRARDADSLAAFGGIVALNRPVDVATAEAIVSTFIEAIIAPSVDEAARAVLARKANMRVVTADLAALNDVWSSAIEYRSILGGVLEQERDRVTEANAPWSSGSVSGSLRVATKRQPTPEEWEALRFAWRICAHVKSNTVIFTDRQRTLAIGAGQMSRVDAVNVALMKAKGATVSLEGSAAASDAFFPFRDGLDALASAGAKAVVQPGGSVRDAEVIAAADEHGIAMVFTGRRHFRH